MNHPRHKGDSVKRAALYVRVLTLDQHPKTQGIELRHFALQRSDDAIPVIAVWPAGRVFLIVDVSHRAQRRIVTTETSVDSAQPYLRAGFSTGDSPFDLVTIIWVQTLQSSVDFDPVLQTGGRHSPTPTQCPV
jgi:hypothetical protein